MNPDELPNVIDTNVIDTDEPKIVKIAKLVMLLADKNVDRDTKVSCILLDVKAGLITQKEAMELTIYLPDILDFM